MIDFTPLPQVAASLAALAALTVVPIAGLLTRRLIALAEQKLHVQVDADTEARIEAIVGVGAGVIRADLAAGKIAVPQITLGSPGIDRAVTVAMGIGGALLAAQNITKDDIAARIVAAVGHALGDDPTVPSAPAAAAVSIPR